MDKLKKFEETDLPSNFTQKMGNFLFLSLSRLAIFFRFHCRWNRIRPTMAEPTWIESPVAGELPGGGGSS